MYKKTEHQKWIEMHLNAVFIFMSDQNTVLFVSIYVVRG